MSVKREDIIVLGDGLEQRTNTKTGKVRFTVKVEPVAINLNPVALGAPVAQAIALHLRQQMKGITTAASPATIKAREVARRAFLKGEAWATKRYAGGKMGARVPAQSNELFNDSGRFAESIVAKATKDGVWRINVAGNRLDPNTANGGAAAVQQIYRRLLELIPEFADMQKLMATSDFIRAKVKAQEKMIRKGTLKELAGLAVDVLETVRRFTG